VGAGTYSFTYSYTDVNGCSAACDFAIVVNDLPLVSCPDDIDVCIDGNVIEFNPGINETFAYEGVIITTFNPSEFGAGHYDITYTITNENGCTNNCIFTITVHALPVTNCTDFDICENAAPIDFNPTVYENYVYNGQVITSFDPTLYGPGNYDIFYTIGSEFSCTNNCMFTITVLPIPVITSQPESVSASWGENVEFTVIAENADNYRWYGPTGLVIGTQNVLSITAIKLSDQGAYYCEVSNGCATIPTATVFLEVLPWSQTINLPLKLNGFSTYLDLVNCNMQTVVAPLGNGLESIEFIDEVYVPGGAPICWDEQKGAKAALQGNVWPTQLTVFGFPSLGPELNLPAGWSIIPVWSHGTVNASDIFQQLGNNLIIAYSIDYSGAYWGSGGIHTLQYLIPGSSYMVKLNASGTLNFDVPLINGPELIAPIPPNKTNWEDVTMTGNLHAIAISKDLLATLKVGDFIGAFNQFGKIGGMVEITNLDENLLLRVFADDYYSPELDGFIEGDQMSFKVYRPLTGEEFVLNTEFDPSMPNTDIFEIRGMSMIKDQKLTETPALEANSGLQVKVYPNPADNYINVQVNQPITEVQILTLLGQVMINEHGHSQTYKLDISKLQAGVYLIKVFTKDGLTVNKQFLVR